MNSSRPHALRGHLRLITGGVHFGLPLDRVDRVALIGGERRLPAGPGHETWLRGATLDGRQGIPVVALNHLLGLRPTRSEALVYCQLGPSRVALECEAVRGIVSAQTPSDAISPDWFTARLGCIQGILRTPGQPVLVLSPETLLPPRRRQTLHQFMSDTEPSVDKLWELSELENTLARNPTASGYRELAQRYAEEGWSDEAARVAQRGDELAALEAPASPLAAPAAAPVFAGAFNPRILLELLQVLHLTGKTGELRLSSPGRNDIIVALHSGRIVNAATPGGMPGEATLRDTLTLAGGRYAFTPTDTQPPGPGDLPDTAAAINRLAKGVP